MIPTRGYVRCAAVVATAVVAALVSGQPALVAVAVPFVLALLRPAPTPPDPAVSLRAPTTRVEQGRVVPLTVRVEAEPGWGLLRATFTDAGTGRRERWLAESGTPRTVAVQPTRMGTHQVGAVAVEGWDPLLLHRRPAPHTAAPVLRVLPAALPVAASEALPATIAFVGEHVARVLGPGLELAGVRPFAAGDRPRQVSWRTTARTGTPHVNAARREHSVRVCLLVDSTCSGELGRRLLAVSAGAALGVAQSYLALGDQVALVEFGGHDRQLGYAAGRANLPRIQDWLADLQPRANTVAEPTPPHTVAGASSDLVIAVSPLVEESAATGLVRLRQRGLPVAVLAALPDGGLDFTRRGELVEQVASQLWALQRERTIHGLARLGVPVVAWAETADLDAALRSLARQARAPRLVLR